jgi:predicted phosphoribosyltransferase
MLKDRVEAGQLLGEQIRQIVNDSDLIVLAIPRGGVIVGHEIAKKLDCLLDVIVSKKITPPDIRCDCFKKNYASRLS